MIRAADLIERKRNGEAHSAEELTELILGYARGEIPDYQLAAWCMAVYFRGLTGRETHALTDAMIRSGETIELGKALGRRVVDKHSTGGVGDKLSLCLAPLVAACGIAAPLVAGRGLGHSGGTLDKLEAIPGYRVDLDARSFARVLGKVGASIIGQTPELVPADRRLYALRDVTGTVESIPLIVASILSKKLATGSDGLVLDVKAGRGAFMKDLEAARRLARALVRTARQAGLPTVALITDMNVTIGRTIGNALEVREAIAVLRGEGPSDTRELTLLLGEEMLVMGGRARTRPEARRLLERALADGSGFERFVRLVRAHGGDTKSVEAPERLPKARVKLPIVAPRSGALVAADPLELAWVSLALGAGRTRADQKVDPAAGVELARVVGERVEKGEPLAFLHARTPELARAQKARALAAFRVGGRVPPRKLLLERVTR